uniref:Uncharacterized protein n=1 Tax=viral metagenome TaxID=1070528 RepID=A0A6H1ZWU4_9ZZZZ
MEENIGWIYLTATQTIHRKACKLFSIVVTPDGTNNTYADVYDGENTNEPKVTRLRVVSTTSKKFSWPKGLDLQRGLHIVFETNLQAVTVESKSK